MAKHYTSEHIEFQNGDHVDARPLTLANLKKFMVILQAHYKGMEDNKKLIEQAIKDGKAAEAKGEDTAAIFEELTLKTDDVEDPRSWPNTLAAGSLIALRQYKVYDKDEQVVTTLNVDYIENYLDIPTLTRIVEIAGSMKINDVEDDPEKKEQN